MLKRNVSYVCACQWSISFSRFSRSRLGDQETFEMQKRQRGDKVVKHRLNAEVTGMFSKAIYNSSRG